MRENLKNTRKAKGVTQQVVSDYLKIDIRHYQKL